MPDETVDPKELVSIVHPEIGDPSEPSTVTREAFDTVWAPKGFVLAAEQTDEDRARAAAVAEAAATPDPEPDPAVDALVDGNSRDDLVDRANALGLDSSGTKRDIARRLVDQPAPPDSPPEV